MSEKPILFSGPMVRAILEGRKTQTRRVVKVQPHGAGHWVRFGDLFHFPNVCPIHIIKSPYGLDGDSLWVREKFRGACGYDDIPPSKWGNKPIWYDADGKPTKEYWHISEKSRPSIHMPRWASRINLEILDLKIERLNDIAEADALAEGITCENVVVNSHCAGGRHTEETADRYFWDGCREEGFESAVDAYADLWDTINGEKHPWKSNPWVWVDEFKKVEAVV